MRNPAEDRMLASLVEPLVPDIASTAAELVRLGWAEANAGNFSIRLSHPISAIGVEKELVESHPEYGGLTLLVTGAGTRMRDVARDPMPAMCLVQVDSSGSRYKTEGQKKPSSELPAHLAAHAALLRCRPEDTALLHTHPPQVTALSLVYPEPESTLSVLFRAHSEMAAIRDRLRMLPFLAPGSEELARLTAAALVHGAGVIWSRHGMIASGPTVNDCLDLIQFCEKAAEVALLARVSPRPGETARGKTQAGGRSLKGHHAPHGSEIFYDVRSQDSSLSLDEFRKLERTPFALILDNLRSAFNVGSILRLADAARIAEVIFCGYTAYPPHPKLDQTALGATETVPWRRFERTADAIRTLKSEGYLVVGAETVNGAVPYHGLKLRPNRLIALVLGNEALGLSQSVLALCDRIIEVPMFGYKNSLNVAAAASILVYHLLESHGWLDQTQS